MVLFGKLLDQLFEIGITCSEASREPVSAALSNSLPVRQHIELARLARPAHSVNVQSLLDQGHETRDLGTVVVSRRTMNNFHFHVASFGVIAPRHPDQLYQQFLSVHEASF